MTFKPLKTGDTIGVFSPSSFVEKGQLDNGIEFLKSVGFNVFIHPQTYKRNHQSAGTSDEKSEAINDLYADTNIKAVMAARGGNRALHLLDRLNFEGIKKNPKALIGYSDVTCLLNSIWHRLEIINLHGPVLKEIHTENENAHRLVSFLKTGTFNYQFDGVCLSEGHAEGILVGGNLTLLHHLIGGNNEPDWNDKVLLLEDTGEEISRLDRTLCHFKQLGIFEKCAGIIFGSFSDLKDHGHPFGFTIDDIIREHTEGLDIPVIQNNFFGHGKNNYPLPIGQKIFLSAQKNNTEVKTFLGKAA